MTESWKDTQLWKRLAHCSDGGTSAVRHLLNDVMPNIETLLTKGGTASLDFTLHDGSHAFRVATRMAELVPAKTLNALCSYELGLLLLSAYLHDVGMTPERSRLASYFKYLLTGEPGGLKDKQVEELQAWLDDHRGGLVPPLVDSGDKGSVVDSASEILTYFARERHNDWGEELTRSLLAGKSLGHYKGWLDDLVLLCKSHHYGYDELAGDAFKPQLVGATKGVIVNLRYLAAVLRVADVLEFDPERTPDVIFRHRNVAESSVIYWHKDHEISMTMEGSRLVLSARPTNARTHRAIEDTVARRAIMK